MDELKLLNVLGITSQTGGAFYLMYQALLTSNALKPHLRGPTFDSLAEMITLQAKELHSQFRHQSIAFCFVVIGGVLQAWAAICAP